MKKLVSRCHRAGVFRGVDTINTHTDGSVESIECWICVECSNPCEVEEIEVKR